MSEVMAHEWMQGDTASEQEAKAEMAKRFTVIQKAKAAERLANNSVDHQY